MSSINTYYEHKVKLKEYTQNSFYLNNDNTKSEKNIKITKKASRTKEMFLQKSFRRTKRHKNKIWEKQK